MDKKITVAVFAGVLALVLSVSAVAQIGREVAIPTHLNDGQEFQVSMKELIAYGKSLFTAVWTSQEGGGRPLTKGTGNPITDTFAPLLFPRNFNRISAPDSNSCSGCHNKPTVGGGGDIVANVFVLGQRFDFATYQYKRFDSDQRRRGRVRESRHVAEYCRFP